MATDYKPLKWGSAALIGAAVFYACLNGCERKDYAPSNIDLKGAKITEKGLEVYVGKQVKIAKNLSGDGKTFVGVEGYVDGWRDEEKKASEDYSKKTIAPSAKPAEPANPNEELKGRIGRLEEKLDKVLKTRASSGPDLTPVTPRSK